MTTPLIQSLIPVSFTYAAGPLLMEACFGLFLSGIMTAQVYFYWGKYQHDSSWTKTLVYSVFFLETVHTGFCLHTLYSYFVLEVEDLEIVRYIVWSAGVILILEMMIVALVQGFYIFRIWQLSHGALVTLVSAFTLFCRCAFGVATSILTYTFKNLAIFSLKKEVVVTVNFGLTLAVVVDVMTAGLLMLYLYKQGARVRQTKHIVHSLMFYIVNTGAMTIVFSMLTLLSFNFVRSSFMFAGFVIISTKVYANSMLAMLNARNRIKNSKSQAIHSIALSAQSRPGMQGGPGLFAGTNPVDTTLDIRADGLDVETRKDDSEDDCGKSYVSLR